MESAYLTKAHEHVRNAATATYSSSIVTAGAEHEQAASAFRNAAQDTHNAEALRILELLENHHVKLAQLIREPPRKKEKDGDAASQASESASQASESATPPPAKAATARTSSPSPGASSPTRAPSRRRLPQSSIASNLAEKRGIPGVRRATPAASPVSVTNALATRSERPDTPVRDLLQRQSRDAEDANKKKGESSHPTHRANQALSNAEESPAPRPSSSPSEDNFRRFYSAFGGVISAISAPLAFTSLPLHPTPPPAPDPEPISLPKKSKSKSPDTSRSIKSSEPDLAALISKPALRALREDRQGALGPFANNESFYVVPTSGGTVSYANILRDQQAHPHHAAQNPQLDAIDELEGDGLRGSSHEEFVDARETAFPPSPTAPRHQRPRSRGSTVTTARTIPAGRGTGLKTMEELQLENETLRTLIDKQAKRLSMWETTSQSSYNALAQSFRARGGIGNKQMSDPSALAQALSLGSNALPSPPPVPSIPPQYSQPSKGNEDDEKEKEARERIAELEALLAGREQQISSLTDEKESLAKQNEKHALVIGRYREQWEKLKAGARKKEQERREKRIIELKTGATEGKDSARESESGDAEDKEEGEGLVEEEPGFGKA